MMGKDCERILKNICKIGDQLSVATQNISKLNSSPVIINGSHSHNEDGTVTDPLFSEESSPVDLRSYIEDALNTFNEMSDDFEKLFSLGNSLYTATSSFNNSIGSPWNELLIFKSAMDTISDYSENEYSGMKSEMISLINNSRIALFDAKYALIIYHDYIQRGFDAKYNDKEPSVRFKQPDKKDSIGNIQQDFDENVNIKKPPVEPF